MTMAQGTRRITPKSQQQEYYDFFGDVTRITWDLYNLNTDKNLLEKKIGFALYGPPQSLPASDDDVTDFAHSSHAAPRYSEHHTGYDKKQVTEILKLRDQIISQNKFALYPEELYMSTVFTLCVTETKEFSIPKRLPVRERSDVNIFMYPVFRIRKCVGKQNGEGEDGHGKCVIFVDHEGRVYATWQKYLSNNRLPQGVLVTPRNGIYNATGANEEVILEERYSPSCALGNRLLHATDTAGVVTGVGATCVCVAAAIPAIPVAAGMVAGAAIVGAATGIYSVVRSSFNLADRGAHQQNIGLDDREARSNWLGIASGSAGVLAGGATKVFGSLVGRGVEIGTHGRNLVNVINGTSLLVNGVGTFYGVYQIFDMVYNDNERPSMLMVFQVSTSIFFFTHSVMNMKTANTIMREKQASVIEEYKSSLRSNRHRKAFTKMEKETIRLAGDETAGRRDIIRSINNIQDKNDFFAGVVRINKGLNANKVKISFASDGTAMLNNMESIDPMKFWADGRNTQMSTYGSLPPPPTNTVVTAANLETTQTTIYNTIQTALAKRTLIASVFKMLVDVSDGDGHQVMETVSFYLSTFSRLAVESFMNFLMKTIETCETILCEEINKLLPDLGDHFRFFFSFVYSYVSKKTYNFLSKIKERAVNFINEMEIIMKSLFVDGNLNEMVLNDVVSELITWSDNLLRRREDQIRNRGRVKCRVCDGYYYGKM